MLVLAYAYQFSYPSKTDLKKLDEEQRKATTWICCKEDYYKNRLLQLDILPVSLYLELHDVLFFNAAENEKCTIRVKIPTRSSDMRQKEQYAVPTYLLRETDENFWTRTARLVNNISEYLKDKPLDRTARTKMYQQYFNKSYSEAQKCTWRILCSLGSSKTSQKQCQMQTEGLTPLDSSSLRLTNYEYFLSPAFCILALFKKAAFIPQVQLAIYNFLLLPAFYAYFLPLAFHA